MVACNKPDKTAVPYTEINSPTNCELRSIQFVDTIGFACGGKLFRKSELLRTRDGGNSWERVALPTQSVSTEILYDLDLLSNGTLLVVGHAGTSYSSTNFGDSLRYSQDPSYASRRGIAFVNNQKALCCGQNGFKQGIITPLVASSNWTLPWNPYQHSFGMNHIDFVDSLVGYVAGFGAIYKTLDGGNSWTFTNAKNDNFTASTWFNRHTGIAIGWEGSILKTANGGDDWEKIRNANAAGQKRYHLKCIAQNSQEETIAAGEQGVILYSNDRGSSWKKIENTPDINLEGIAFQNDDTFFVVGAEGRIFKFEL